MGGWDNKRLEFKKVKSTLQALTALSDKDFKELNEYYEDEDCVLMTKAGKEIEKLGAPILITFASPAECVKLHFTIAKGKNVHAGVVALAVET